MKSFAVEFAIVFFLLIFGSCLGKFKEKPQGILNLKGSKKNLCVWETTWMINNQAMLYAYKYTPYYNSLKLSHDADWKAKITMIGKPKCTITKESGRYRIVCPDGVQYFELKVRLEKPGPAENCLNEEILKVTLGNAQEKVSSKK